MAWILFFKKKKKQYIHEFPTFLALTEIKVPMKLSSIESFILYHISHAFAIF